MDKNTYIYRINQVIDYVRSHLDEELSLQTLASLATFSPFHFHRIFKALTGETVNDFVRRVRLETFDNLDLTATDKCRYDAGFTVPDTVTSGSGEVGVQDVPAGRYAVCEWRWKTRMETM